MGILDGFQFDPQSYAGGVPNWLEMALRSQGAGPSQGFPNQQQASPMSTMGGAAGYGAGMDMPPLGRAEQAQLPPTAMPVAGQGAPAMPMQAPPQAMGQPAPAPAASGPGLFDRLSAGATNFTTGGNPIAGLLNMMGGLATGQRTDRTGIAQQNQQATATALYHALSKSGRYSPEEAKGIAVAAATNPALAAALLPQAFGSKYEFKTLKGPLGDESLVATNPIEGTAKPVNLDGGAGGGLGGPQMLAPGVKKYDATLSGQDYMNQFGPEVQAIAKAHLNGDQMPTGNPRIQGIIPFAKTVAAKYAQDMGIPFSDTLYAAKRKMQTDLASSGNSSIGGIISNGKSAFEHLANLSDKFADLGNYSSNIPLVGGHLATAENWVGNVLTPTSDTKAKLTAVNDNALKYGQESTKFYAGSGGGEAERMAALKATGPTTTSGVEQAAFLQTEKELMLGRLRQKAEQIRETMGDEWVAQHPERNPFSPDVQKMIAKVDANIAKLRGEGGASPAGNSAQSAHSGAVAPLPAANADGWIALPNGIKIREKK